MTDKRTVIDMKDLLEQRVREGNPLVVIEPTCTSDDTVKTLKKLLPEDTQNTAVLVDLGKNS